ncbi:MAG: diphthine synthase [Candidatus Aenigmatarchaeota archaeon]
MLYLIGLGIWDETDISLKGIEYCKKSKEVFAELYTAKWGGSLKNLEKIIGKKIRVLERRDLEEKSFSLVDKAKNRDIAVLVPGDPLSATTHLSVVCEAKELGIPVKIIHSSSIFTAVAECGLSIYNFGKTVSIPSPQENFHPSSFADNIIENRKLGLHTLVLLDIGMGVAQGVEILLGIEKSVKKKIISEQKIVACSCLGSESRKILYRGAGELLASDLGPPAVLIIPGRLHFMEKEFLERL